MTSAESHWYKFADMPPPLTVKVRVLWSGREFIAARAFKDGHERWGEYRPGSDSPRPVQLTDGPELWQPIKPGLWQLPLPEPVILSEVGRMVTERIRFQAVDDAEAADLAREMERDRADAQRGSGGTTQITKEFQCQWWRDATLINYREIRPDITLKSAEGRLMRAVACCGAGRVSKFRVSPIWLEIGAAAAAVLAEKEAESSPDIVRRFEPLRDDETDFLTAMGWFAALYPPEQRPRWWARFDADDERRLNRSQRIILWRARNVPLSFAEIGSELKFSGERAQQIFRQSIEDCWRMANGLPNRKGVPVRIDHMAVVRERNRRTRRASA